MELADAEAIATYFAANPAADADPALPATVALMKDRDRWRDAYTNMRDFAVSKGLDITATRSPA